jgi:hypothetical protein
VTPAEIRCFGCGNRRGKGGVVMAPLTEQALLAWEREAADPHATKRLLIERGNELWEALTLLAAQVVELRKNLDNEYQSRAYWAYRAEKAEGQVVELREENARLQRVDAAMAYFRDLCYAVENLRGWHPNGKEEARTAWLLRVESLIGSMHAVLSAAGTEAEPEPSLTSLGVTNSTESKSEDGVASGDVVAESDRSVG